jgi:hypothetical protein
MLGLTFIPSAPAEAAVAPAGCPSGGAGSGGKLILGTTGDDTIGGTPGDDYICGGDGADHIYGGGGNDVIWGGPGDDWLEGGAGSDRIHGGAGDDQIFADAGPAFENAPVPTALAGDDIIFGDTGADSIEGGPGSDIILAGGVGSADIGAGDHVHGGPGNDVLLSDFRHPSGSDSFFGDEGDDIVWPNPIRLNPLGNTAWGGTGQISSSRPRNAGWRSVRRGASVITTARPVRRGRAWGGQRRISVLSGR